MTTNDLRKEAEALYAKRIQKRMASETLLECIGDAMLAFAAEQRKVAIADCAAMCYSRGEVRAAEAIEKGVPK